MRAWGKLLTDPSTGAVLDSLDLVDHCIDVASVFRELCKLPAIHRNVDRDAGRALTDTDFDRLAVFALFHDLGKCNGGFQAKADPAARRTAGHVREVAQLLMNPKLLARAVQTLALEDMAGWFSDPENDLLRILLAVVSHHGEPAFVLADITLVDQFSWLWANVDGYDPFSALAELGAAARDAFPAAFQAGVSPLTLTLALEHRIAGLVMLADWIGSHREAFFPFHHDGNRIPWARRQARRALQAIGLEVGLARRHLSAGLPPFADVFGIHSKPRPLQAALSRADLPPLLIAESDTGSGKTEAALLHFLSLFAAGAVDGLFFALPTRVAARELYDRVGQAMQRVFGPQCPSVLLAVPGYAQVDGEPAHLLPTHDRLWHEAEQAHRERAWSAERPKRFLAAPIAVGTLDQALFAGIQVPHAHLRAVCLGRSLLVVDEVHSSDTYMRYLCRHVLARHLAAGGRALLLSATLGSAARAEYLSPAHPPSALEDLHTAAGQPYPSLCAPERELLHLPDPTCRAKRVRVQAVMAMESPETLIEDLRAALRREQRVMIILNTVTRVLALMRLVSADPVLEAALFTAHGQACPHHGRFARPDRELLDRELSQRMGKGSPPGPLLLIGTQTLEQSLDIDADWLISDLCPIDVLLQRIGRLHRHDRGPREPPVCTVLLPCETDFSHFLGQNGEAAPRPGAGLGSVYEDLRVLQLTRDWAASQPLIEVPHANRLLVESATHPERLASLHGPKWAAHAARLEGNGLAQSIAAHSALIPDKHFGDFAFPRLDARLATRLGLNDRTIALGGRYLSPFGREIEEINLPGHLAVDLNDERAHLVRLSPGMLLIHVGALIFRYSRFGLEKLDESVT